MEETCKRVIQHTMQNIGKTHKSKCDKPVYRDGLCKDHYTKFRRKTTPWGERSDYKVATLEEMKNGKHFKLRYSHANKILRLRFGLIQEYKSFSSSWEETNFPVNPEAYCIKK